MLFAYAMVISVSISEGSNVAFFSIMSIYPRVIASSFLNSSVVLA